jgi:hypothetical protein
MVFVLTVERNSLKVNEEFFKIEFDKLLWLILVIERKFRGLCVPGREGNWRGVHLEEFWGPPGW